MFKSKKSRLQTALHYVNLSNLAQMCQVLLCFQAEDRTLTDQEVAKAQGRIVSKLEKELGARLRA